MGKNLFSIVLYPVYLRKGWPCSSGSLSLSFKAASKAVAICRSYAIKVHPYFPNKKDLGELWRPPNADSKCARLLLWNHAGNCEMLSLSFLIGLGMGLDDLLRETAHFLRDLCKWNRFYNHHKLISEYSKDRMIAAFIFVILWKGLINHWFGCSALENNRRLHRLHVDN